VTAALGLDAADRQVLAENSFRASFLPEDDVARHLAEIAAAVG
jgi:adenosine deaminase